MQQNVKDCAHLLSKENKYSPVVLANSSVIEGIAQMLVLAVGEHTFKNRNQLSSTATDVKVSNLQNKLNGI